MVITIIAVLAAILFPVFLMARAKARAIFCLNNLKQFGSLFAMYQGDWDGKFPYTALPAKTENELIGSSGIDNPSAGTWYRRWGELWTSKLEPYVKYPLLRFRGANTSPAQGILKCKDLSKKWMIPNLNSPDDVGFGYNFLYLGLPFKSYTGSDNPLPPDDGSNNPYRTEAKGEFFAGAAKLSNLKSPGETICLVENRFLWAFPPFKATEESWTSNTGTTTVGNQFIRPRHGTRSNVLWADGHVTAVDTKSLVTTDIPFGDGVAEQVGIAADNTLWDRD